MWNASTLEEWASSYGHGLYITYILLFRFDITIRFFGDVHLNTGV